MVLRILAVSLIRILTPVACLAQIGAAGFVYVFPRFTESAESSITATNLNPGVAEVEIDFYKEDGTRSGTFLTLLPSTAETLSAEEIGASSVGSVVVSSLSQIQISATVDNEGISRLPRPRTSAPTS